MDKENLVLFDDNLAQLETTRGFMPQLTEETRETDIVTAEELRANPNKVIAVPNEYEVEVQDYETAKQEQEVPIYDDNGEITGYEIVEVDVLLPSGTHKETRVYYTLDLNPNFEDEEAQKEKERIAQLNMTRGDFIEGLILAQGKDEKDIIALIEALPINEIEKKVYINRVNNALDFYRGYPVIDVLCGFLNVPLENMDKFFETKDYNYLKPVEDVVNPDEPIEENSVVDEITDVEDVNNPEDEVNNE